MTRLLRGAAVALMVAAGSACGGDNNGPSGGSNTMTASIGGTNWSATLNVTAVLQGGVLSVVGNGGSGADGFQINLAAFGVDAAGTYNFGAGNFTTVATVTTLSNPISAWVTSGVGGTGSLVITSLTSTRVEGTFSFTGVSSGGTAATGTKVVTNGKFNARF